MALKLLRCWFAVYRVLWDHFWDTAHALVYRTFRRCVNTHLWLVQWTCGLPAAPAGCRLGRNMDTGATALAAPRTLRITGGTRLRTAFPFAEARHYLLRIAFYLCHTWLRLFCYLLLSHLSAFFPILRQRRHGFCTPLVVTHFLTTSTTLPSVCHLFAAHGSPFFCCSPHGYWPPCHPTFTRYCHPPTTLPATALFAPLPVIVGMVLIPLHTTYHLLFIPVLPLYRRLPATEHSDARTRLPTARCLLPFARTPHTTLLTPTCLPLRVWFFATFLRLDLAWLYHSSSFTRTPLCHLHTFRMPHSIHLRHRAFYGALRYYRPTLRTRGCVPYGRALYATRLRLPLRGPLRVLLLSLLPIYVLTSLRHTERARFAQCYLRYLPYDALRALPLRLHALPTLLPPAFAGIPLYCSSVPAFYTFPPVPSLPHPASHCTLHTHIPPSTPSHLFPPLAF